MKIAFVCVIIPVILANPFRPFEIEKRIVGGTTIPIADSSYSVYLQVDVATLLSLFQCGYVCTGSIISKYIVASAAHCSQQPDIISSTFQCAGVGLPGLLGTTTVSPSAVTITAYSATHSIDGTEFEVSDVFVHPLYDAKNFNFDLALFKTINPFRDGSIIPLASVAPPTGTLCFADGWGKTNGNGNPSSTLQRGIFFIQSEAECQATYAPLEITDQMVCGFNQGVSGCNGDSGGPFTCEGNLVGVTSFVARGCDTTKSTVSASVIDPQMRSFINPHIS